MIWCTSSCNLVDSELINSFIAVYVSGSATPQVHNCSIYSNAFGVYGQDTTWPVSAENNWWGDVSGPSHPSNPLGTGQLVTDNVDFDPWLGQPPNFTSPTPLPTPPPTPTPVSGVGTQYPAGQGPYFVVTDHFNNDAFLDLATANSGSNTISILLGDGLGGFSLDRIYEVGNRPTSIGVGDFNSDGRKDLAVTNFNSNTITILLGEGDGRFTKSAQDFISLDK